LADDRHPGGAADQNDRVDISGFELGVGEREFASLQRARDERFRDLFEIVASQNFANRMTGQLDHDFSFGEIGEKLLGISAAMRALFQTWRSSWRFGQFAEQPIHERAIDIVAAEMSTPLVASTSKIPSLMLSIEMSKCATEVVDRDVPGRELVQPVGERGRSRSFTRRTTSSPRGGTVLVAWRCRR